MNWYYADTKSVLLMKQQRNNWMYWQLRWYWFWALYFYLCLLAACQTFDTSTEIKNTTLIEDAIYWQEVWDGDCGLAYNALNLEMWAGFPIQTNEIQLIDSFVIHSTNYIEINSQKAATYSPTEAIQLLTKIGKYIKQLRKRQVSYHGALYVCLRYGLFDCDINSFLYLTLAHELNLPLKAVILPNHMLVLWQDSDYEIWWETTENKAYDKQYYLQKYNLKETAAQDNMLLRPLNTQELQAVVLFNIANTYSEWQYYEKAISIATIALQVQPKWYKLYDALGHYHHQLQQYEAAIWYYLQSVQLLGSHYRAYRYIGQSYQQLGCNTEAINTYQKYLRYETSEARRAEVEDLIEQQQK